MSDDRKFVIKAVKYVELYTEMRKSRVICLGQFRINFFKAIFFKCKNNPILLWICVF